MQKQANCFCSHVDSSKAANRTHFSVSCLKTQLNIMMMRLVLMAAETKTGSVDSL